MGFFEYRHVHDLRTNYVGDESSHWLANLKNPFLAKLQQNGESRLPGLGTIIESVRKLTILKNLYFYYWLIKYIQFS